MVLNFSAFAQLSNLQNINPTKQPKSETLFQGMRSSKSIKAKTADQLLKAVNTPSHRLDSIVAAGFMKMSFTYDAQNRPLEQIRQEFDVQWNYTTKTEYVYDTNGYLWKIMESDWDANANDWVYSYRNEYQYDTEGRIIVYIYSYYELSEATWYDSKEENTFDENGDLIEIIQYDYDNFNQIWLLSAKMVREYNSAHQEISSSYYYWDLGTMAWNISSRNEYELDSQGNITLTKSYYWDDFNQEWVLSYQMMTEFIYDSNFTILEEINANWESMDSSWVYSYKLVSSYDSYGNMLSQEYYSYDDFSSVWAPEDKQEFEYNTDILASDLIAPLEIHGDLDATHMITSATMSFWAGIGWMPLINFTLYYSELISVPSIDQISFEVYPNPVKANEVIHLTYPQGGTYSLMVTDMQGRDLKKLTLKGESTISLQGFTPGVYFLKMNQNNSNSIVKRILVQ